MLQHSGAPIRTARQQEWLHTLRTGAESRVVSVSICCPKLSQLFPVDLASLSGSQLARGLLQYLVDESCQRPVVL